MAISAKPPQSHPSAEHLSVEMSPSMYRAIVELMKASELELNAEQFLELLEDRLEDAVALTITEVTGVQTPFPQGVEVDLQVADEDDDSYIRESIKQGFRDVLKGDVLTEEEFWKAVADDE